MKNDIWEKGETQNNSDGRPKKGQNFQLILKQATEDKDKFAEELLFQKNLRTSTDDMEKFAEELFLSRVFKQPQRIKKVRWGTTKNLKTSVENIEKFAEELLFQRILEQPLRTKKSLSFPNLQFF